MSNLFLFAEAVHSIALSHPEGHGCDVCRAAGGDVAAKKRLLIESVLADLRALPKRTP